MIRVDSGYPCGFDVASDSVDMAPDSGTAENKVEYDPQDNSNPHCTVDFQEASVIEQVSETFGLIPDEVGVVIIVDQLCDTSCKGHGTQCSDECRKFQLSYQETIRISDCQTCDQGDQAGNRRVHIVHHQGSGCHAGHTD